MKKRPDLDVATSVEQLGKHAAQKFADLAEIAIRKRDFFAVALSGGNTPVHLYNALVNNYANEIEWDKVYFFLGDERNVPVDHFESNAGNAFKNLLNPLNIHKGLVQFPEVGDMEIMKAASDYEQRIKEFFNTDGIPKFDLIYLGLGDDGHTASLFPDTKALQNQSRLVVENWIPKFMKWRLTFTYPLINNAHHVAFLISGAQKADKAAQIYDFRGYSYPAAFVMPDDGDITWFMDEAAAKFIPHQKG